MRRQMTALILALLLVVTAAHGALAASESYSARTPLSGAGSSKLNNLRLAAQAIDGMTVAAGECFSFNGAVGPREKGRGYREAPNGRGVMVTGGGVAQAASTLYMALLQMGGDVEIDPVKTYGARFSDDYVQNPSMAIVTDYDAGIDLSFTNLGEDMSIDMWLGEDDLWCVLTVGQGGGLGSTLGTGSSGLSFLDGDAALSTGDGSGEGGFFTVIGGGKPSDAGGATSTLEGSLFIGEDDGEDESTAASGGPLFLGGHVEEGGAASTLGGSMHYDDDAQPEALGSSAINCGGDKDVLHNVTLAADCLNDTVLDSGDTFSFNDVVGPRTKKYGYRRAVNGRGAKVTGGGVAQVASALWLAVEDMDDIEIVEKSTYGKRYNQRYVSDAADAILTDYASGRDFRFRYTGDSSLTIYAYVDDGWLYCEVFED